MGCNFSLESLKSHYFLEKFILLKLRANIIEILNDQKTFRNLVKRTLYTFITLLLIVRLCVVAYGLATQNPWMMMHIDIIFYVIFTTSTLRYRMVICTSFSLLQVLYLNDFYYRRYAVESGHYLKQMRDLLVINFDDVLFNNRQLWQSMFGERITYKGCFKAFILLNKVLLNMPVGRSLANKVTFKSKLIWFPGMTRRCRLCLFVIQCYYEWFMNLNRMTSGMIRNENYRK